MASPTTIRLAETESDLVACYPVMAQLRQAITQKGFMEQIRRQRTDGYRVAMLEHEGRIAAVAGFRLLEYLAWGKAMYVDDLVTDDSQRSRGHGRRMFEWLVEFARRHECGELHLDSGVQRFDAHRFYLARRMRISSLHFSLNLKTMDS